MCGILGLIGNVDPLAFNDALDLMTHRGPDASGVLHKGDIHFGHRRLSIIDLSEASNQPMTTDDLSHSIIFNGEIYNFSEVREELIERGYPFRTSGDTEVVLTAYLEWGEDCLSRFNGMFAFGIINHETGSLFLARDRLGIKPLLYYSNSDFFSFASEPKALIAVADCTFDLNIDSVISYLSFRYPASGATFFQGIHTLPQGHWMRYQDGQIIEIVRYWDLRDALDQPMINDPEIAVAGVRKLLSEAVSFRTIADVPVGAYLSGGVDSSAITALMALDSELPVQTFTIGFHEEGFNEFREARIVADRYSTVHHEIQIDLENYLDAMEGMIRIKDAPLGVPNEVPLHLMSKVLKKEITVVLSGEGADEIFGGYGRIFRSADDAPLIEEWARSGFETSSPLGKRLHEKYGGGFDSEFDRFMHLYRYTPMERLERIVCSVHLKSFKSGPTTKAFQKIFEEVNDQDFAIQMMYVFERLHLPGLLQRVDATTMAASVEARVPFVDHNLVEYAFRLSKDLKMRWKDGPKTDRIGADISEVEDIPKWVLKEAMAELLPVEILHRRKVGFPVPLQNWFETDFLDEVKDRVLDGILVQAGVLDRIGINDLFEDVRTNSQEAIVLWMLLNLEIFLETQPMCKLASM